MFTGIIEGLGLILSKYERDGNMEFRIEHNFLNYDLKIGDSIAINGVCQTVTHLDFEKSTFDFYSSYKTLELTNLGSLKINQFVNLERSLLPTSRMGGHFVSGHVDTTGEIVNLETINNSNLRVLVRYSVEIDRYFIQRGSVTIDGISLTIVSKADLTIELVLIPETVKKTNVRYWTIGTQVNIEIDLIARYLESLTEKMK